MVNKKYLKRLEILVLFILINLLIEAAGSYFTQSSVLSWYPELTKPSWNPPAWVFGPVWTILYITIGIAGWRIYLQPISHHKIWAFRLYWIQLALNFLWSFLFFYLQNPLLALVDLTLLSFALAGCIAFFWKIAPRDSCWLLPYFLWTLYALSLNWAIYALNR